MKKATSPKTQGLTPQAGDFCRYTFQETVLIETVNELLQLSLIATESIHGEAQTRLDARHNTEGHIFRIYTGNQVGIDLNRLFAGFVSRVFAPESFTAETITPLRTKFVGRSKPKSAKSKAKQQFRERMWRRVTGQLKFILWFKEHGKRKWQKLGEFSDPGDAYEEQQARMKKSEPGRWLVAPDDQKPGSRDKDDED